MLPAQHSKHHAVEHWHWHCSPSRQVSSWHVLGRDHIGICKCQVWCQCRHCKHTCILLTLQTGTWVLERLCCNAHTLISCVCWRHTISDRQLRSSVFIYAVCFKACCQNHAQEALSCCSLTQPSRCCGCCCCMSYLKSWVPYFYDSIAQIGYSHMTYYCLWPCFYESLCNGLLRISWLAVHNAYCRYVSSWTSCSWPSCKCCSILKISHLVKQ